jgi:hypothetical protein
VKCDAPSYSLNPATSSTAVPSKHYAELQRRLAAA